MILSLRLEKVVSFLVSLGFLLRALVIGLVFFGVLPIAAQAQTAPPAKLEALQQLLADPEIKAWIEGQKQAAPVNTGAAAPVEQSPVSVLLSSLRAHMRDIAAAAPRLPAQFDRASSIVMVELDEVGLLGIVAITLGFVFVGLTLDWIAHRATWRFRHWMASQNPKSPWGRMKALWGRLIYAAIMIVVFTLGSAGIFLIFEWPPLLREIILDYLLAAIAVRAILMVSRAALLPSRIGTAHTAEFRILPLTDAAADHLYRWIAIISTWFAFTITTLALAPVFGFEPVGRELLAMPFTVVLLVLLLLAIWLRPHAVEPGHEFLPLMGHTATTWVTSTICVLLCIIALTGTVAFWFVLAAVLLPLVILVAHRAVHFLLRPAEDVGDEPQMTPVRVAVIDRGIRVLLIVAVAYFLARTSGLDMAMMTASDTAFSRLMRSGLNALIIVLAADFGWSVIKAVISRKLGENLLPSENGTGHPTLSQHQARVRTLLPIIQNILFAAILVITLLMVLSSIGIEIAPLIAGAGVIGVAIGFGAQTLVKDVISGIFYLLDDAFRVGEFIQSGNYKGTVESFSLRSVKLRHHRGYLSTVPFGELGSVQNMSRDWVIDKFSINVDYATDIEKARKIIKKIGLQLAADPEFAPYVIEPLKMQGVENFGDYGIELRIKMMTVPGEQFMMRRRAYVAIKTAFEEQGIKIPFPTVHVREGGEAAAAAAQLMTDRKVPPPAA